MCGCERCESSWSAVGSGGMSVVVCLFVCLVLAFGTRGCRFVLFCFMGEEIWGRERSRKGSGDVWRTNDGFLKIR